VFFFSGIDDCISMCHEYNEDKEQSTKEWEQWIHLNAASTKDKPHERTKIFLYSNFTNRREKNKKLTFQYEKN
jgi:hypothetical protein